MVISDVNRFVFIEVPLTGSWAIGNELCECYDAKRILHKHASWRDFARWASADQISYYCFGTVRHPMDEVVSAYFKLRNNHKMAFTDPQALNQGWLERRDLKKYSSVINHRYSFDEYFKAFHKHTFCSMIDLSAKGLNYVMRYENLQQGFNEVLKRLNVDRRRPLPVVNLTERRSRDWESYYSASSRKQVMAVFAPFMERWDYAWPSQWHEKVQPSRLSRLKYQSRNWARSQFFAHVRYNNRPFARAFLWARAQL